MSSYILFRARRPFLVIAAALVTATLAHNNVARARAPINKMCPVMTEETVKPEFTTVYQGQLIGLCCDKCLAKFEANPNRYAARVSELQAQKPQPNEVAHPAHEHGDADAAAVRELGVGGSRPPNENAAQTGQQRIAHEHDRHPEEDEPPAVHDHVHDHATGTGFLAKLIAWLGRFHPPTVNFPIAMIIGAALAELLLIVTGRAFFANAGRFCLWVGALGALAGSTLGWFLGGFHLVDDSWVLTSHRWLGTTTAAWSVLLLVCGERTFRRANVTRRGYRLLLFIAAGLVGVTGFFGGSLIYGLTHYAWQ